MEKIGPADLQRSLKIEENAFCVLDEEFTTLFINLSHKKILLV